MYQATQNVKSIKRHDKYAGKLYINTADLNNADISLHDLHQTFIVDAIIGDATRISSQLGLLRYNTQCSQQ